MLEVNVKCPFCGKNYTVEVPEEGYKRWQNGALIQVAMPNTSPEVREALISGICRECWDSTFGGMDND